MYGRTDRCLFLINAAAMDEAVRLASLHPTAHIGHRFSDGIESGVAAGAHVAVVTATHNHSSGAAHPAIEDYHGLQAVSEGSGVAVLGITASGTSTLHSG